MLDGSSIASILGVGAIGLGFLLAFLTYNLLRHPRADNTPIYVFQFFCFALVIVGAVLQYSASSRGEKIENMQSQIKALEADLNAAKSSLPASQAELQTTKGKLDAALQKSQSLESNLTSLQQAMARIANMVPDSIKELEAVNAVLTGDVCSGGANGIPIWGGKGTVAAARSSKVMNNLAAAKSSIESFLPAISKN